MIITGTRGFIGGAYAERWPEAEPVEGARLAEWLPVKPDGPFVHIGADAGVEQCRENAGAAFQNNVHSTHVYLRHATHHNMERFVFVSSAAADSPRTVYGATKAAGEAMVEAYHHEYGLPTCIVRLSNVYGPGSLHKDSVVATMIKSALRNGTVTVEGDGWQERSFVYIDDVLSALNAAHLDSCERMVVEGTRWPIEMLALWLAKELGATIEHTAPRPNDTELREQTWGAVWTGSTDIERGLDRTIEYFRECLRE